MQGLDIRAQKASPAVNSGTWSPVEDTRLKDAVAKYGTRWVVVAGVVGTRNGDQCAKRWNENLNPELDHSPWSSQEETLLLQLVDLYGHNWKFMASSFLQGRAPLSLKNRYSLLMRRRKRQGGRAEQLPSPTSTSPTSPSPLCGPFDPTSNFNSGFPFEEVHSRSSSHSRRSYSETDGELSSPVSRVGSVRELKNLPGKTANTQNAGCYFSTPTPFSGPIVGDNYFDSRGRAQNDWWDHSPWPEVADVDVELSDAANANAMGFDRSLGNASVSVHKTAELSGALSHSQDQMQDAVLDNNTNNTVQYSVSCQRGKLKTLVHHLVDAAMSETTVKSAEEDEVTLTLRLQT
ncbi:hypothetical protein F5Y05DRAFT_417064 [Hypoxylon sp. FL0543]|nr:hypothetical protein F5Y05DRAFT_417064 [Hypoxylon sp. FL0543]